MTYPSRAAYKLLSGLEFFRKTYPIEITGRVCMDLGCAQGGFVQVLLEQGARQVYAVDVGYGVLDYGLRTNERVIVRERHNLRHITQEWLSVPDQEELLKPFAGRASRGGLFCTCDASFISARTVVAALMRFQNESNIPVEALILVKPQFEASRCTQKGVISDPSLQKELVDGVAEKARQCGFEVLGSTPVEPTGTQGNQEYMLYVQGAE